MRAGSSLLLEFLQAYPFQPATAWWRAIEVAHLLRYRFPAGRGLDVGCGDGCLTQILDSHGTAAARAWVGIEPDAAEATLARQRNLYAEVLVTTADCIDKPDGEFDFALANSVLEHIVPVEPVLREIARLLKPGAPFVLTVPSVRFHESLRGPSHVRRVLLRQARPQYLAQIDRRVAHLYYWDEPRWRRALGEAGFEHIECSTYLTTAEVQRWETVSNLTAGILYELLGRRPPIEIQRRLGLRRARTMPRAVARGLAWLLSTGVRPIAGDAGGGLMLVGSRAQRK